MQNKSSGNGKVAAAETVGALLPPDFGFEQRGRAVIIWDRQYPEYRYALPTKSDMQAMKSQIDVHLPKFRQELTDYLGRLEDLNRRFGITLERNHSGMTLAQPDMRLSKPIRYADHPLCKDNVDEFFRTIEARTKAHNAAALSQIPPGFEKEFCKSNTGSGNILLALTHKNSGWGAKGIRFAHLVGSEGIIGKDALKLIQDARKASPELSRIEPESTQVTEEFKPIPSLARKPVTLVLDSTFVTNLSASRKGYQSWLDLISLVSELPNIHVVITSINADSELCGMIPSYKDGKLTLSVNNVEQTKMPGHANRMAFIKAASRQVLDESQSISNVPGENSDVTIFESAAQRRYFNTVLAKKATFTPYTGLAKQLRDITSDQGEHAIAEYCKLPVCDTSVIIVSDDNIFNPARRGKLSHIFSDQTAHGKSIGLVNTYSFLQALTKAYGSELSQKLEERYGGKEPNVSLEYVTNSINLQRKLMSNNPVERTPKAISGRDKNGIAGPDLEDVFRAGIELQAAQLPRLTECSKQMKDPKLHGEAASLPTAMVTCPTLLIKRKALRSKGAVNIIPSACLSCAYPAVPGC